MCLHTSEQDFTKFLKEHPEQERICAESGLRIGQHGRSDTVLIGLPTLMTGEEPKVNGNLWVHSILNERRSNEEIYAGYAEKNNVSRGNAFIR